MNSEYETLRWPTNLDREAIVDRLVKLRELAQRTGLIDFADRFTDIEAMPAAKIGAAVIGALSWLQDRPEHSSLATQLEMVAVNLKNLR